MGELLNSGDKLFQDVSGLIPSAKVKVASVANSEITILFWNIGNRIN